MKNFNKYDSAILIGTTAISLGLHSNSDLAIIHKAPNSLEELIQMIGRVGRN